MNAELKRLIALERYRNLAVLERAGAQSMKPTKGPWKADDNSTFIHANDGKVYVAQANHARDVDLIAAAPEMLAALQKLIADGNAVEHLPQDHWERCCAAIAKAEGRANAVVPLKAAVGK